LRRNLPVLDFAYFGEAMPDPSRTTGAVRFGPYEADFAGAELRKNGRKIKLQDRPFDILQILLERPGEVISREEFCKRLWPADTFVDFDHSLNASINKLRQALNDDAESPRFVATVGRRGYKFIASLQATEPQYVVEPALEPRVPFATEVEIPAAEVVPAPPGPPAKGGARARGWRWRTFGLLSATTVVLLICAWTFGGWPEGLRRKTRKVAGEASNTAAAAVKPRRSFAVFGLKNLSGKPDEAWLSTALSEMLTTELAAGEQMRAVPGEKIKIDLGLANADGYSPETLTKIRANLGSDVLVLGSYTVLGEKSHRGIRVDLRLQDASTGEMITEVATTGTEGELFALVSRVGAHLRKELGVVAPSVAEAASVQASLPSNPEAARLYSEGLAKLRIFDALLARDLLREAVVANPCFSPSHSALALAWSTLGYDGKAKEEAQRAVSLSGRLSREEQLVVDAGYREVTKDWTAAVEKYRTLFALFPDNLDYGLHLLQAQIGSAHTHEAELTLATLRRFPSSARDDPRVDLAEANLGFQVADYKRTLAAASRAAASSETLGARLLLARARRAQGAASRLLGDNDQVLHRYAEAKDIFEAAGDRVSAAGILRDIADTTAEQGDYAAALKFYRTSLAEVRKIGSKGGVAADLNNMGVVLENQRDFVEAQKLYEQATVAYREVGDVRHANIALGNGGETRFYRGNLTGAEASYRRVIDFSRQIGDTDLEAYQLSNGAILLAARGDLPGAKTAFEQALSLWRDSNPHESSAALLGLGQVELAQGDLIGARKTQEEALARRQKLGERGSVAESRLALAEVSLEEGRAADAESAANDVALEFQREKVPEMEATAYTLLARAQVEEGKYAVAQRAVKRATSLSTKGQEPLVRLSVAIVTARAHSASDGDSATRRKLSSEALHQLSSVVAEARKFGFLGVELEARLAMGEVEMQSGLAGAGSKRLADLEKNAQAKGYALLARKAAAARL
jgi:eukaryotic-like serine/threonine-protein kinase